MFTTSCYLSFVASLPWL